MRDTRILFVCHGNICRSPMAESIMAYLATKADMPIIVNSAATSADALGWEPHIKTQQVLEEAEIPLVPHNAVRITKNDYDEYDYLIGMDSANIRNMKKLMNGDPENKISRLLDFTIHERDIDDPWYTNDYDKTFEDIMHGCKELLRILQSK